MFKHEYTIKVKIEMSFEADTAMNLYIMHFIRLVLNSITIYAYYLYTLNICGIAYNSIYCNRTKHFLLIIKRPFTGVLLNSGSLYQYLCMHHRGCI